MITIDIEKRTLQRLQEHAEPLVDTVDTVINRLIDSVEEKGRGTEAGQPRPARRPRRAPKGEKTPNEEFYKPIIQVLREAGGELRTAKAVDRVGELMRGRLNDTDLGELKTGEPRWRNTVRWARNDLVNRGALDPDAPHGVWRLANGA